MATLSLCLRAGALAIASIMPANAEPRLHLAESEVKAALIYSFLRYTQWPGVDPHAPLVVCVWREDGLEGRLDPIAGRTVNQRVIDLRLVRRPDELVACSLLYIDADQSSAWPAIQSNLAGHNILTVSDATGFVGRGGMIELSTANNRVGVRLDAGAVQAAGLSIEARLLRLANASSGSAP